MQHYFALVHKDSDSAYGVHFPDVPGCFSASDTLDDLLSQAREALALHLEGEELPLSRTLDELRSNKEVQEHLDAGAFILSVPYIRLTGRTVKANITMDAGLLSALDATARERGLTRSALIADLARHEILG